MVRQGQTAGQGQSEKRTWVSPGYTSSALSVPRSYSLLSFKIHGWAGCLGGDAGGGGGNMHGSWGGVESGGEEALLEQEP